MTPSLPAAAAEYLNAHLSIIALSGKAPNVAIHKHGLNQALTGTIDTDEDRALIDQVFTHPDTTGIGIVIPNHAVVVDIDGEDGAIAFVRITGINPLELPETPIAKTGRGLHLWFMTPAVYRSTKLDNKLDLKGVGGYVAAPPSLHPDGHRYEWLEPLVNAHGNFQADWIPDTLESALNEQAIVNTSVVASSLKERGGSMDGLANAVRFAEEGNRNSMLYWAACSARDSGFTAEEAITTLAPASTLPRAEAVRTIRSAFESKR